MKIKKRLLQILFIVFTITLLTGCGGGIQLTAPDEVKAAIENNTPAKEYGYYVLKGTEIESLEELAQKTLLVCGEAPINADVQVAASSISSLGKPLFRASQHHFINPNIDCQGFAPCARSSQTVSFKGIQDKFVQEGYIYKSRTDADRLLLNCITAMHDDGDLLLLIKRDELRHQKGAVSEIEFK